MTGQPAPLIGALSVRALIRATRGDAQGCGADAVRSLELLKRVASPLQIGLARYPRGLLALGAGDVEKAIEHLRLAADAWVKAGVVEPGAFPFIPDLAEALARCGHIEEAADTISDYAARATAAGRREASAAAARVRGLIAPGDTFDEPFREALALHADYPESFARGRTLLAYGERLRGFAPYRGGAPNAKLQSCRVTPPSASISRKTGLHRSGGSIPTRSGIMSMRCIERRGLCGSPQDAEDLVQETFLQVLKRPRFVRPGRELAYLFRALRNTYSSRYRSAVRRPQLVALADDIPDAPPEQSYDTGEIMAAIASAQAPYRDAVVAVDLLGFSYREAARALGAREATIASRLHRGRQHVAAALLEPSAEPAVGGRLSG